MIYTFSTISTIILAGFFAKNNKIILKFTGSKIAKINLGKKRENTEMEDSHSPILKLNTHSYKSKTM